MRQPFCFIVINKRGGPFPEDYQLLFDQVRIIINTLCSIPADIFSNAIQNSIRRTIENDKRMNMRKRRYILCLAHVARNAVQHEDMALRKPRPVQEKGDDLFCEREVLVFEQETALKNAVNKIELFG